MKFGRNLTGVYCAFQGRMWPTLKEIDAVTEKIIGCAIEVHKNAGAGLLESAYRECLSIEMHTAKLSFECQRTIRLSYKGVPINPNYKWTCWWRTSSSSN